MLLEQRALPSNVSNSIVVELWEGLIHIKAIRLTTREAASQAVQGTVGLLSCVILLSLLGYLFSHVLYVGHGARKERAQTLKRFLATDMGVYLVMLLISDLGMSIAAIVDIPWSRTFLISHTPLCEFQGIANQLGVFAAAFWNLCLAFQTFLLLFIRYTPPSWAKWVVVPFGWTFAVLMTILGPIMNKSPYAFYGPNSAGCWLTIGSSNYKAWLLTAAYFAISCLVIMAVIYIILFLSLSGALEKIAGRMNSSTGRGSSSNPSRTSTAIPSSVTRGRQVRSVARKMLWFPVSYATLSLPLVVCTLLAAKGKILDHEIYIASNILFVLVSVADVAIFALTRRHLLSSSSPPSTAGHGGISMTVVTSTFNPPNQSGSMPVGRALPYVRSQSPVDSLESEVASYIKGSSKEGHDKQPWETTAPSTTKQVKRSSKAERSARSQGHEDSFGLTSTRTDSFMKIDCTDEESRSSKVTLA